MGKNDLTVEALPVPVGETDLDSSSSQETHRINKP